jgi:5-formyltetrahydrofolate cyclo-ligase
LSTVLQNDKESKTAARAEALRRRDALSPEERAAKGHEATRLIMGFDAFKAAQSVLLYAAFRSELPTDELIWVALGMGKKVLVPKVDTSNRTLSKHVIECLSELEVGYQGIPEPRTDTCWKVEDIELIVIPGLAFDTQGHRIGYGGGYYDRLLPRVKGRRPIVALAFEEQLFDYVPTEAHDITVDVIITDKRVITCHG